MSRIEAAGATIRGGVADRSDAWRLIGPPGEGCVAVVADAPGGDAGQIAVDKFAEALSGEGPASLASALEAASRGKSLAMAAVRFLAAGVEFATAGDVAILRFRDGEVHQVNAREPHFIDREYEAALGKADWRDVLESDDRYSGVADASGALPIRSGERKAQPGDIYLVATDGLDTVGQELLRRLASEGEAETAERLGAMAVEAAQAYGRAFRGGRHDHATVVAVRYAPADQAPDAAPRKTAPLRPLPLALAVLAGIVIGAGVSPFVLEAMRPEAVVVTAAPARDAEPARPPRRPAARNRPDCRCGTGSAARFACRGAANGAGAAGRRTIRASGSRTRHEDYGTGVRDFHRPAACRRSCPAARSGR